MIKIIEFEKANENLKQLLEEVNKGINQYIIRSNEHDLAVLISFDDYQRYTESKEQAQKSFYQMVDELREYNKDVPYK